VVRLSITPHLARCRFAKPEIVRSHEQFVGTWLDLLDQNLPSRTDLRELKIRCREKRKPTPAVINRQSGLSSKKGIPSQSVTLAPPLVTVYKDSLCFDVGNFVKRPVSVK
jgi:hypothetical protein